MLFDTLFISTQTTACYIETVGFAWLCDFFSVLSYFPPEYMLLQLLVLHLSCLIAKLTEYMHLIDIDVRLKLMG